MTVLNVTRLKTMPGSLVKMKCFVDDRAVLELKNGESGRVEAREDEAVFTCMVNRSKTSVRLDLRRRTQLDIDVYMGNYTPVIKPADESAVIPEPEPEKKKGFFSRSQDELYRMMNEDVPIKRSYELTQKAGAVFGVNDKQKIFAVGTGPYPNLRNSAIHKYSDLIGFELVDDGDSIASGGVGRAVVGGVLFGGAGAIVGAVTPKKTKKTCNYLAVRMTLNNMDHPLEELILISSPTDRKSGSYRKAMGLAQQTIALLQVICRQNETDLAEERMQAAAQAQAAVSPADEIRKYKELMDEGIISAEEFEAKKKQLLGI